MVMDALNATAQQLADQAQRFSFFTGLVKPAPQYRFFLVAGKTRPGKSTIVARCTGKDVIVGHELYSCPSPTTSYTITVSNGFLL